MNELPHLMPFILNRTFAHSKETLFKAWTDRERLKNWFGPREFDLMISEFELRPGGTFLYSMRLPNGFEMWGKWVFVEIQPIDRLVFIVSFSDPQGGVTRHPMSETWPLETLSTIIFTEENGRTTIALKSEPINATEEEITTFTEGHASMTQGWTGTLDKLEEALAAD